MKKQIKIGILSILFMGLYGCEGDFLDEQPSQFLNINQLEEAAEVNPAIAVGFVDGIYAYMVETFAANGVNDHQDFGHKAHDIYSDMLTSDMALSVSTFGWYRAAITEYQAMEDFTFSENLQVWAFYYTVIRSANTVIEIQGGADNIPELEVNQHILGQALALRAFGYYYLHTYFASDYVPTDEVLPLYDSAIGTGLPKATTADVYALMESDLNKSIDLLSTFQRSNKAQINQSVAKGLLAYVIASTKETSRMQEVANLTSEVMNESGATLMNQSEVLGGFNDVNTPGWLWGIDITQDLNIGLVSFWGQVDHFSFSYAWAGDFKTIDSELFSQIPNDDIRKLQFKFSGHPQENQGSNAAIFPLQPFYKFYDAGRVIGGASQVVTADYVYMRYAEMLLLNAEANAKAGNTGAAQASLTALLSQRVPDASYVNTLSGQALLDEIYLQTRIELWGEGKTYQALKRNERNAERLGNNHLSLQGEIIPFNDNRMTFEIPEREIQDNPEINTQNP